MRTPENARLDTKHERNTNEDSKEESQRNVLLIIEDIYLDYGGLVIRILSWSKENINHSSNN